VSGTSGALMYTAEHIGKILLVKNNVKIPKNYSKSEFCSLGMEWDCGILQ
jgi:hypothetical protein